MVAHGVCHGAVGALTTAHLHLSHKTDLRKMVLGFPMADEIPDDVNILQLIAEFSDYAEAIAAVVDVEQSSRTPPLGVDSVPLCVVQCAW